MHQLRRDTRTAITAAAVAIAVAVGCSSDDYGSVGSSLPTDVSQDSLAVEVDALLPVEIRTIEVQRQTPEEKELLYLGGREGTGWQATPLFRFDFSETADTTQGYDPGVDFSDETKLSFQLIESDADKVIQRTVDVYELAQPLEEGDADRPLAELLGTVVSTQVFDVSTPSTFEIDIDPEIVKGWVDAGRVVSLAVVSRDEVLPETFPEVQHGIVGAASDEISLATTEFIAPIRAEQTNDPDALLRAAKPEIEAEQPGLSFINVRPELDFTHFQLPADYDEVPRLESHRRAGRLYFVFAPEDGGIPSNATINRAELELTVRTGLAVGRDGIETVRTITGDENGNGECDADEPECEAVVEREYVNFGSTLRAYTGTPTEVERAERPSDLEFVLRGDASIEPFLSDEGEDRKLVIDVTDYLQRFVNGVFDEDGTAAEETGVVLALSAEVLEWTVIPFYDVDDPDPSRRPRLNLTFTPPADFWR